MTEEEISEIDANEIARMRRAIAVNEIYKNLSLEEKADITGMTAIEFHNVLKAALDTGLYAWDLLIRQSVSTAAGMFRIELKKMKIADLLAENSDTTEERNE